MRPVVATQLPPEGSVVPDDPITRHKVPQVSRGPSPPIRPPGPSRGDIHGAHDPISGAARNRDRDRNRGRARNRGRGRGKNRGRNRDMNRVPSPNWGERTVRCEPVLMEHHQAPPSRHPEAVHYLVVGCRP